MKMNPHSLLNKPQAEISNGIVKAKIYLPDPENGYYQGTRFDHSANMPVLEWNGHSYFGQWFPEYHPEIHDAIMGPVEEFTSPDFPEKKAGSTFLKIGVGELLKPDDEAYRFDRLYPVTNPGKWSIRKESDRIDFTHHLQGSDYSYRYQKTVSLTKGSPEMVISHMLRNTGRVKIETSVYNHNFFMIDTDQIGPDVEISFPFRLSGEGRGMGELAELKDTRIEFLRNIIPPETVFIAGLTGFSDSISDYDIRIENRSSRAGVRITCDRPLLKINFWSCSRTACPEPYIMIKADPGEEFSWNIVYKFFETGR